MCDSDHCRMWFRSLSWWWRGLMRLLRLRSWNVQCNNLRLILSATSLQFLSVQQRNRLAWTLNFGRHLNSVHLKFLKRSLSGLYNVISVHYRDQGLEGTKVSCLMPITHVPEIGIENRYLKTGTGFWCVLHAVCYRILMLPISGNDYDMLYFCAGLWCRFSCMGFWYWFLVGVLWALTLLRLWWWSVSCFMPAPGDCRRLLESLLTVRLVLSRIRLKSVCDGTFGAAAVCVWNDFSIMFNRHWELSTDIHNLILCLAPLHLVACPCSCSS